MLSKKVSRWKDKTPVAHDSNSVFRCNCEQKGLVWAKWKMVDIRFVELRAAIGDKHMTGLKDGTQSNNTSPVGP